MAEDVVAIRKKVMEFIDGPEGYLKIPYEGPDLNPRRFWHRSCCRAGSGSSGNRPSSSFARSCLREFKNRLLRSIGMNIGRRRSSLPGVLRHRVPRLVSIGEGRWSER
jgi:hypothetical protein